ncbi:MAG TPA: hypothetical protein VFQ61_31305, partial [Polyangiaceae bacterium]|nr:hypothetical protein [Polyangiaceae bacterium]
PAECRTEFGEAGKDRCFGRAGLRELIAHPGHFLALIPRKLSATFDWSGAPGHYLTASNSSALSADSALLLGIVEAVVLRLSLLACLWRVGVADGPRRRLRRSVCLLSAPWLFLRPAWISYLGLCMAGLSFGRDLDRRPNVALGVAAVASTALVHAVFFGAGRYGLVCVLALLPLIAERRSHTLEPTEVTLHAR